MSELEKLFQKIDNEQKNEFLLDILRNNERIKTKFMEKFLHQWENIRLIDPPQYDLSNLLKEIKKDAQTISSELNELNFEDIDWDLWDDPGYYVPDYEAAEMIAEDMADQAIEGLTDTLVYKTEVGSLTSIVSNLISTLHGIGMAEINDPHFNLSDDPNGYFFEKVYNLVRKKQSNLSARKFLSADFINALELFLNYQQRENCGQYLLSVFTNFWPYVIQTKEQAETFMRMADDYNISVSNYPLLVNKVLRLLDDKQRWVKTMEDIFLRDYQSSEDLMAYYYKSDMDAFKQKAASFFGRYKDESYEFLLDKIEKGSPVHISLLKHAAVRLSSIKAFQELKKYISPEEARLFIDSVHNPEYRIKLLNNEKQYDKIKEIISGKLSKDSYYSMAGFNKSIQYLYIPDPDAAIRLTKQNINLLMESRRNRNTYQYIAELLKQSLAIPGKTSQVKSIAKDLYNHKPNLPALKDELRKAGLI